MRILGKKLLPRNKVTGGFTYPLLSFKRNVGCDVRGDFKIFDFSLARELKDTDLVQKPDEYNLTCLVGTRRWMAPEVCLCKNYGFSSDVYSFCVLFWHVMTLILPFDGYDT